MNKPHLFRKKPVVIEAVQFVGHNSADIAEFTDGAARYSSTRCGDVETDCYLIIPTLEGDHKANVGDWIIKGVHGEFYPCKPDIFAKTYDVADGGEAMNSQQIEQEIQAKGKTAARVTPADIEANIASEHYFTAGEGVIGAFAASEFDSHSGDSVTLLRGAASTGVLKPSLNLLTFCVLVLKNGFTVTGESACASPENFDAEIGRKIARQNAIAKVWQLLGFRLRDQLAQG